MESQLSEDEIAIRYALALFPYYTLTKRIFRDTARDFCRACITIFLGFAEANRNASRITSRPALLRLTEPRVRY